MGRPQSLRLPEPVEEGAGLMEVEPLRGSIGQKFGERSLILTQTAAKARTVGMSTHTCAFRVHPLGCRAPWDSLPDHRAAAGLRNFLRDPRRSGVDGSPHNAYKRRREGESRASGRRAFVSRAKVRNVLDAS